MPSFIQNIQIPSVQNGVVLFPPAFPPSAFANFPQPMRSVDSPHCDRSERRARSCLLIRTAYCAAPHHAILSVSPKANYTLGTQNETRWIKSSLVVEERESNTKPSLQNVLVFPTSQ